MWALIESLLPPSKPRREKNPGRLPVSNRAALTGILFVLETGLRWRDLPAEMGCGSGVTCWRRLRDPQRNLWQVVLDTPAAGHMERLVPAKRMRAQRKARLTLRYAPVRLQPHKARASELPALDVFAIHAIEDKPPAGIEPLEWMLLSSVPTHSPEQTLERLRWYARRWTIETWHRVLKSGCRIEARQFGTIERFVRATALFAVIAWRILYTTLLARLDGELPCKVVLQRVEWQALYCRVHRTTGPPGP